MESDQPSPTVQLQTQTTGNVAWAYISETDEHSLGTITQSVPNRSGRWCNWSHWAWDRSIWDGRTTWAIYVYDACNGNRQLYNLGQLCSGGSDLGPGFLPSLCVTLDPRTIPVGITPQQCHSLGEIQVGLQETVTPKTYDPHKPTTLTATTSFGSNFQQLLSQGTCTDVLNWQVMGWTFEWPSGKTNQPGTGQSGTTATHAIPPQPLNVRSVDSTVRAIAHLHIHGQAMDFDANGNLVVVPRDAFVDIDNTGFITASGLPTVYTPPTLTVGGVAVGQNGDGTFPSYDATAPPTTHVDTIRGHLLDIYPRAVVLTPGVETVDGFPAGTAATTTTSWRYTGGRTDAPGQAGTSPGATGGPDQPVQLQWNNVERLDSAGNTIDEQVPIALVAHTVWPDGHAEDETITAAVPVTIWYVAMGSP